MSDDEELRGPASLKIVQQRDGRFRWQLINPNGTLPARSMHTFATEDEALANTELNQRVIAARRSRAEPGDEIHGPAQS